MTKKMLIDATHAEETRVVVADGNIVEEFDFETASKRQLAGNIYLAKVTRVEPSLQAAFVEYGGNRHGFLAFAEIHPDYYQIPAADREALKAEERAEAEAEAAEDEAHAQRAAKRQSRRRSRDEAADNGDDTGNDGAAEDAAQPEAAGTGDAVRRSEDVPGMAIAEADDGEDNTDPGEDQGADHGAEPSGRHHHGDEARPARKPRARRYKIQEVIKTRQIMLVQVVKEERGNKGAALTTYLSLAGRYCVLMPNTARGGGISRKITNAADRKKLKDIAGELEVPQGAGLIIRTAGSQRTRTEIRRDYEYLMRLWEQIRELTFKSTAPAPIYEEGDLIKRSIRDLYSSDIDEVLVEGERGWRTARDFMAMIMPSHAGRVRHYRDPMPLFARHQVETYLGAMFNPVVQLKSGGYIVIGITEALVAIDVNSGRATKEGSIEETAYKTNLEAADEIARQLRLRDLAGLIVIDFIDMDERKHNAAVEKRVKDRLKTDRARIQIGRISDFGLMEMSRQRLRPGMLESTTQPCAHCHGTGLIRSDDSLALTVLRAIEEEGTRKRSREVLVRAPVAVINFLINTKREHVAAIETRFGMAVRLEADPALISPDFTIEKFKTASRIVSDSAAPVVSADADLMAAIDEAAEENGSEAAEATAQPEARATAPAAEAGSKDEAGETRSRSSRRRRRRRPARSDEGVEAGAAEVEADAAEVGETETTPEPATGSVTAEVAASEPAAPAEVDVDTAAPEAEAAAGTPAPEAAPTAADEASAETPVTEDATTATEPQAAEADTAPEPEPEAEPAPAPEAAESADPVTEAPVEAPATAPAEAPAEVPAAEPALAEVEGDTDTAPKRRGWWNA